MGWERQIHENKNKIKLHRSSSSLQFVAAIPTLIITNRCAMSMLIEPYSELNYDLWVLSFKRLSSGFHIVIILYDMIKSSEK